MPLIGHRTLGVPAPRIHDRRTGPHLVGLKAMAASFAAAGAAVKGRSGAAWRAPSG
jgi:hypothetical protein